jgi:hypothetical protein
MARSKRAAASRSPLSLGPIGCATLDFIVTYFLDKCFRATTPAIVAKIPRRLLSAQDRINVRFLQRSLGLQLADRACVTSSRSSRINTVATGCLLRGAGGGAHSARPARRALVNRSAA